MSIISVIEIETSMSHWTCILSIEKILKEPPTFCGAIS
jgi:hypothetical protein